jgi:hypothetical protein
MTVDEFVKTKVLPEFQPVVAMVRELMREMAPDTTEAIRYGIPSYKGRKIFAVISPTKKDITLSFSHGGEFEDKFDLLRDMGIGREGNWIPCIFSKKTYTVNIQLSI